MARPHGTKYISSPEKLWELFAEYKEQTKSNPILVEDYVGKDGERVFRQREQPLIMEGFECFVMTKTLIKYPDLTEYFEGKNESYKDYFPISARIKKEIRFDQVKLGLANVTNPSLTARINGLKESTETEIKGTLNIPNLPDIGNRGKK